MVKVEARRQTDPARQISTITAFPATAQGLPRVLVRPSAQSSNYPAAWQRSCGYSTRPDAHRPQHRVVSATVLPQRTELHAVALAISPLRELREQMSGFRRSPRPRLPIPAGAESPSYMCFKPFDWPTWASALGLPLLSAVLALFGLPVAPARLPRRGRARPRWMRGPPRPRSAGTGDQPRPVPVHRRPWPRPAACA